jgi:hypothetical protein
MPGRSILVGSLLAVLAALSACAVAHPAATLTYPPDGATVALDKDANFTFTWTVPAGETMPSPYVGDSPAYDPDTFAPFGSACGALSDTATSCRPDTPMRSGRHYAFMFTTNADNTEHYLSPVTSFVVPPTIAWGCGPSADCPTPRGFRASYVPHPPIGLPYSTLEVSGWTNAPEGTPITFTFTIKHGRKVVARAHDVQPASDYLAQSGFELLHSQIKLGHRGRHWHAPAGGTRLTCTYTMSGSGLSLTRTARMRTPPR